MSRKEALSQFINQIHGRPVVVKLNSGVDYRGKLTVDRKCDLCVYGYASEILEFIDSESLAPRQMQLIKYLI